MNKRRRKEIKLIVSKLSEIVKCVKSGGQLDMEALSDIISDLECIFSDEECYRDNIPENLQESIRYETAEASCDNLESAVDLLNYIEEDDDVEYIIKTANEAIDYLNDAM